MKNFTLRNAVFACLCALSLSAPDRQLFAAPLPPPPPPIAESPVGGPDLAFVYIPGAFAVSGGFVVENRGTRSAEPFTIEFRTDAAFFEDAHWVISVAGLAPGGQSKVVVPAGKDGRLDSCTALRIDPDNQVMETDETNNILMQWTYTCGILDW